MKNKKIALLKNIYICIVTYIINNIKCMNMKQWMINLILFLIAIVAIAFSLLRVIPFEVTDATYVGTMVTLMGIIVTILIGYQIYNAIELKKEIKEQVTEFRGEIESQRKELNKTMEQQKQKADEIINRLSYQENNLINLNNELNENLNTVLSFIYEHEGKNIASFAAMHAALLYSMCKGRDDYSWPLKYLKNIIPNFNLFEINEGGVCQEKEGGEWYITQNLLSLPKIKLSDVVDKYIEPVKEEEKKIRENKEFKVIALVYNPLMEQFYQKVEDLKNSKC